jgi:hypothetical protein
VAQVNRREWFQAEAKSVHISSAVGMKGLAKMYHTQGCSTRCNHHCTGKGNSVPSAATKPCALGSTSPDRPTQRLSVKARGDKYCIGGRIVLDRVCPAHNQHTSHRLQLWWLFIGMLACLERGSRMPRGSDSRGTTVEAILFHICTYIWNWA